MLLSLYHMIYHILTWILSLVNPCRVNFLKFLLGNFPLCLAQKNLPPVVRSTSPPQGEQIGADRKAVQAL